MYRCEYFKTCCIENITHCYHGMPHEEPNDMPNNNMKPCTEPNYCFIMNMDVKCVLSESK